MRLMAKASTADTIVTPNRTQKELVCRSKAATTKPIVGRSHHLTRTSAADTYQAREKTASSMATGNGTPNQLCTVLTDEIASKEETMMPLSNAIVSSGHSQSIVMRGLVEPAELNVTRFAGIRRRTARATNGSNTPSKSITWRRGINTITGKANNAERSGKKSQF
jgi:hypothetical protein